PFRGVGGLVGVLAAPGLILRGRGDAGARGRGMHSGGARALGLAAIVLLTGAATAAVGPIAFLGLVVPHLARIFTGPDYRWLVPYSGLFGALLLLIADVAGRLVARPGELEVGAMLAVLGVPFFLAFVRRRKLVNL
ncbi:FecCD family ABC transporter permease, partial [Nocardia abscessus]|uniref:FecCD family ABC transporter permease n=1 Tax=Nocardia abscessus TaxID=120957 RepID=UPI0024549299